MHRNAANAIALALAVGLGIWFGANQPSAHGQKETAQPPKEGVPPVPHWEYRTYVGSDLDFMLGTKATEAFNKLGADGWEYVGPIVSREPGMPPNNARFAEKGTAFTVVLFKRAKK